MSNIDTRHNVLPFVAGTSKPLTGQRLARIGYKSTEKQKAKYPSVCASLPLIPASVLTPETVEKLTPHILAMLTDAQDGVLRSLYESSDGTLTSVSDDDLSVDACIGYLTAVAAGGRLTADIVAAWFEAQVAENLTVVIATKLGFEELNTEQMKTIGKHLSAYKGLILAVAGGKQVMTPTQLAGVRRALEVSSVDDDISRKLLAKVEALEKKPDVAEMLEL